MKRLLLIACVGIMGTLLVTGCGKGGNAEDAVRGMLDAAKAGDGDKAISYMDFDPMVAQMREETKDMDEETKKMMGDMGDPEKFVETMKNMIKADLEKDAKEKELDYKILGSEAMDNGRVKVTVQMIEDGKETKEQTCEVHKKAGKWMIDVLTMK